MKAGDAVESHLGPHLCPGPPPISGPGEHRFMFDKGEQPAFVWRDKMDLGQELACPLNRKALTAIRTGAECKPVMGEAVLESSERHRSRQVWPPSSVA